MQLHFYLHEFICITLRFNCAWLYFDITANMSISIELSVIHKMCERQENSNQNKSHISHEIHSNSMRDTLFIVSRLRRQ